MVGIAVGGLRASGGGGGIITVAIVVALFFEAFLITENRIG